MSAVSFTCRAVKVYRTALLVLWIIVLHKRSSLMAREPTTDCTINADNDDFKFKRLIINEKRRWQRTQTYTDRQEVKRISKPPCAPRDTCWCCRASPLYPSALNTKMSVAENGKCQRWIDHPGCAPAHRQQAKNKISATHTMLVLE